MSGAGLSSQHLAGHAPADLAAALGYLNLPPVGALDDAAIPATEADAVHELPLPLRTALGERRLQAGGKLARPEDLLGVAELGPDDLEGLVARLRAPRYGNRLSPIWGGPAALAAFEDLIESATRSISISTYILGGEVGVRLAEKLAAKVKQGVKVRLMFCATGFVISGSPSGAGLKTGWSERRSYLANDRYRRKRVVETLRARGVPFIDSAPITRHWRRLSLRQQGITDAASYRRWQLARGVPEAWLDEQAIIDRRCFFGFTNVDHRKMAIADGRRAIVGSQNISDAYLYENQLHDDPRENLRRWQWHDASAWLEGPAVRELERLFARRWALSGGDLFDPDAEAAPARPGDAVVTIATSIPGMATFPFPRNLPGLVLSMLGLDRRPILEGENPIRQRLLALGRAARETLLVEHCYPSDPDLLGAWAGAGTRLRQLLLLAPDTYDTKLTGFECDRFFPELAAAGMELYAFRRAIMHTKIAVADRYYTSVGSYNVNLRSARADLEMQLFVQCPGFGRAVHEAIEGDLAYAEPLRPGPVDRVRSRFSLPVVDALLRYFVL